jgi:hypothetical protein
MKPGRGHIRSFGSAETICRYQTGKGLGRSSLTGQFPRDRADTACVGTGGEGLRRSPRVRCSGRILGCGRPALPGRAAGPRCRAALPGRASSRPTRTWSAHAVTRRTEPEPLLSRRSQIFSE